MYTRRNFKSKKALREAVKAGEQVRIYQPGPFGGDEQIEGTTCIEGPHYPAPHTWYATVTIEKGIITRVQ